MLTLSFWPSYLYLPSSRIPWVPHFLFIFNAFDIATRFWHQLPSSEALIIKENIFYLSHSIFISNYYNDPVFQIQNLGTEMVTVSQVTHIDCIRHEIWIQTMVLWILYCKHTHYAATINIFTIRIRIDDPRLHLRYITQNCVVICMPTQQTSCEMCQLAAVWFWPNCLLPTVSVQTAPGSW